MPLLLDIPLFKTECGEYIYGSMNFQNDIVHITLIYKGSQFLRYITVQIINILHNRRYKYFFYLDKIFWRMDKINMQGKRREMANEILSYINTCIVKKNNNAFL